jgi:hypothetical protein
MASVIEYISRIAHLFKRPSHGYPPVRARNPCTNGSAAVFIATSFPKKLAISVMTSRSHALVGSRAGSQYSIHTTHSSRAVAGAFAKPSSEQLTEGRRTARGVAALVTTW